MGVRPGRQWERQAVAVLTKVIHRLVLYGSTASEEGKEGDAPSA